MKVRYTVFDGEIVEENRNGTIRDYLPDAIGSTVALLDSSQAKTDTFSYWPYGEIKARTGSTSTAFCYVGARGYFSDNGKRIYVRARYLNPVIGSWLTIDPLWPSRRRYTYCEDSPTSRIDPSGKQPWPNLRATEKSCEVYLKACHEGYTYACNAWKLCLATGDSSQAQCVRGCLRCAFKERPLSSASCWDIFIDHALCMKACGFRNPCFSAGGFAAFRQMCESDYQPGFWVTAALLLCGYHPIPTLPAGTSPGGRKTPTGKKPDALVPKQFSLCDLRYARATFTICGKTVTLEAIG